MKKNLNGKNGRRSGAVVICSPANIVNGTLSLINAREKFGKAELVSGQTTESSTNFWKAHFVSVVSKAEVVIVVGLRIDEQAVTRIREATLSGIKVHIVVHAEPTGNTFGHAWEAGATVTVAPSRGWAFWGPWTETAVEWAKIGGALYWDPKFYEDSSALRTIASGVRQVIKEDHMLASRKILEDDKNFFRSRTHFPPVPTYELKGEVALFDVLEHDVDDQIAEAIFRLKAGYGVGLTKFRRKWEVLVCRNWARRDLLPASLMFGLVNHDPQWKYSKNSGAIVFRFDTKAEAYEWREKVVAILNSPGPESFGQFNATNYWKGCRQMMNLTEWPWYMTDHNWTHVVRMLPATVTLCGLLKRNSDGSLPHLEPIDDLVFELFAATHDVGHAMPGVSIDDAREMHHGYSHQFVLKNTRTFSTILTDRRNIGLLAELCLRHRSRMDLPEKAADQFRVLIGRIGDQCDMDSARAEFNSFGEPFKTLKPRLPRKPIDEVEHFESSLSVRGVRMVGGFNESGEQILTFELVCSDLERAALQVARMEQEVDPLSVFITSAVRAVSE